MEISKNELQKPSRFIMNMDLELKREIKIRAIERNISMAQWMYIAILDRIKKENQYK